MNVDSRADARMIGVKSGRWAPLALLGLAMLLQVLLLVEVGARNPEGVPVWFTVAVESFSFVAGTSIVYLSVELSRIQQVRYPLIVAVAFGAATIVSGIIVIGAADGSLTREFMASSSVAMGDLYRLGRYATVAPLAFLPLSMRRVADLDDPISRLLVLMGAVLVVATGVLLLLGITWRPDGQLLAQGQAQDLRVSWFYVALSALCIAGSLYNLRGYRATGNRLLLGAAIFLVLMGLSQSARIFSIQPHWLTVYLSQPTRMGSYAIFGLILLGEYVRGYRHSVAFGWHVNSELERKVEHLQMLIESTKLLNATLEVQKVQEALLDVAVRLTGATVARLLVHDDATGLLEPRSTRGITDASRKGTFSPTDSLAGGVFTAQKPEFVVDISQDPRAIAQDFGLEADSVRFSFANVPLVVRGKATGVLQLLSPVRLAEHSTGPGQIDLLSALASQAAVSLDNARLFERTAAMHEQLRLAGLRLEAIIDAMPEGVCIAEAPSGRLILANNAADRIFGQTVQPDTEVKDHSQKYHLFRPSGEPFPYEELPVFRSICCGETCCGVEMDLEPAAGKKITILVNSAPIEDTQGSVIGAVIVFQDITRLKQVERMKDDFLALVSHDLKTPLTTIKGYASTLAQDDVYWTDEEQRQFISIIGREADRLTRRVQDLIDVSSIASGNLRLRKGWCDIKDLIEVTIERLGDSLAEREVKIHIDEGLPFVAVDAARLRQVLTNLLDNAVKFSGDGSQISIRARLEERAVLLSVSDCGIGIDSAYLPRVFDRFSHVHDAPKYRPGGKGLGLAICQGIVEGHGGKIWVDSSVGNGSTFTLSLPLVDGEGVLE